MKNCPTCHGKGRIPKGKLDIPCWACEGSGELNVEYIQLMELVYKEAFEAARDLLGATVKTEAQCIRYARIHRVLKRLNHPSPELSQELGWHEKEDLAYIEELRARIQ